MLILKQYVSVNMHAFAAAASETHSQPVRHLNMTNALIMHHAAVVYLACTQAWAQCQHQYSSPPPPPPNTTPCVY